MNQFEKGRRPELIGTDTAPHISGTGTTPGFTAISRRPIETGPGESPKRVMYGVGGIMGPDRRDTNSSGQPPAGEDRRHQNLDPLMIGRIGVSSPPSS